MRVYIVHSLASCFLVHLFGSPTRHTSILSCVMCVRVCVCAGLCVFKSRKQCANNNHFRCRIFLKKYRLFDWNVCPAFSWKFDLIPVFSFLSVVFSLSFKSIHLYQSTLTLKLYHFLECLLFAMWSSQCLRWQLWHCNFIPNNCCKLHTTSPNANPNH